MSVKDKQDEFKQKTPKGHEIPISKRGELLRNLRKVSNVQAQDAVDPRSIQSKV